MLFRFASAGALVAAASMAAAPLAAAEFPRSIAPSANGVLGSNGVTANDRRWRHRDRIDGGDVVAGVLVIGAIAAIAGAASSSRNREYRYPQSYPQRYPAPNQPYDYRTRPSDSRYGDNSGIDRAVDMCAREVGRNAQVDTVDSVERNGDGWRVTGRLGHGDPFTCSVSNDGRVDAIDYGQRGAENDRQWDDDRYAAARQAQEGAIAPAYPGGPVNGDSGDADDGYDASGAPDFRG